MTPLLEEAGGPEGLKKVITSFYDSVFSDVMIGYLFTGLDKARLIEKETEFSAKILDGSVKYTGQTMKAAHQKHQILGGHFDRRVVLLQKAMDKHKLPQPVQAAWLDHTHKLRMVVTRDPDSNCSHERAQAE